MRSISKWLCGAFAAIALSLSVPAVARADAPGAAVSRPVAAETRFAGDARAGTPEESQDYARRESESPQQVQEYAGGAVYIGVSLLFIVLVVILIIVLSNDE
jgi:hypothetical protein